MCRRIYTEFKREYANETYDLQTTKSFSNEAASVVDWNSGGFFLIKMRNFNDSCDVIDAANVRSEVKKYLVKVIRPAITATCWYKYKYNWTCDTSMQIYIILTRYNIKQGIITRLDLSQITYTRRPNIPGEQLSLPSYRIESRSYIVCHTFCGNYRHSTLN